MAIRIPLSRPYFDAQELAAVQRVLNSGWVVQGPEVAAFETEIASLHQARHCVVVSSGTAALHVSFLALGIGPGDAIFIPSFAWPSAANMAKLVGAHPVFVEVLPDSYNVDPADLRARVEECERRGQHKPRAIVPVHEFGLAAAMDEVLALAAAHSLQVIEDAACALGASYRGRSVGTLGNLGVFSFHPRKSITTGEGGAIVTNDARLAEDCRSWRNHGQQINASKRDFILPGLNYRMTEIQAAIGRIQLSKFSDILKRRRDLATHYLTRLTENEMLRLPLNNFEHTWQTFMLVLDDKIDRRQLVQRLAEQGIEAGPGSVAGHLGAHFQPQPGLAVSDLLARQGLALPLHAGLDVKELDFVIDQLCRQLEQCSSAGRPKDGSMLAHGRL